MMEFRPTIGLEVHVQLRTRSKMFCGCATAFGAPPNTQICPVCLGYPGAMPVMNGEAVRLTVRAGLMLGCRIADYSKFDRKSYFYPDMPKNYQISQYDRPLCLGGGVDIPLADGSVKRVGLTRIHLEEDVAKSMHFGTVSGVDFNRAGVPLMEIVTEPEMDSPDEAYAFLLALKQLLEYAGVSDCDLEKGNVRCDVNCSVRPAGQAALGTKIELKNLNTFKGVHAALQHELARQVAVLRAGGRLVQETRRWEPDTGETFTMRTKEDAHDYRYFPEPDLMPVVLTAERIAAWAEGLPERPRDRRARLVAEYGLPDYDAGVLVADKAVADWFERAARARPGGAAVSAKAVSNWIMTEMLRLLGERGRAIDDVAITPEALAGLVRLTESGAINSNSARDVFAELFDQGGDPDAIVARRGLAQVSDGAAVAGWVDRALTENPASVDAYLKGKLAAAKFLVGQVMKMSRGKANPQMVQALLDERLQARGRGEATV